MAKLIARLLAAGSFLGSNPDSRHLSKIQNGRHKQRSGQHSLVRQNNIQKKDHPYNFKIFIELRHIAKRTTYSYDTSFSNIVCLSAEPQSFWPRLILFWFLPTRYICISATSLFFIYILFRIFLNGASLSFIIKEMVYY